MFPGFFASTLRAGLSGFLATLGDKCVNELEKRFLIVRWQLLKRLHPPQDAPADAVGLLWRCERDAQQFIGTYTYDILDERVESDTWATLPGLVQTRTSYDNGQAWADLSTSNAVLTRYLYDPNGDLVARYDIGTGLRQIFTDELGSVRDVTDTTGAVLDHFEYTSVGAIFSETGSTFGVNYGFDGLYVSRNPAINFSLHRQFSTSADAWMQMDPSGFAAGDSNLYRSNGNDPTNETDPSGLQEQPFNPQFPGSSQPSRAQIILGNHPNVATSVVLLTPASAASLMGLLASPGGSGALLAASEGGVYPRLVDSFSSLYILPTKEGKFSRDEFEKLINNGKLLYDPNKPIAGQNMIGALDHLRLDAGCIGCTHIAVIPSQQYLDELTTIYGKDIPGSGPALQMMKVPCHRGQGGAWLGRRRQDSPCRGIRLAARG
jgi:RHS repeat-associated protein